MTHPDFILGNNSFLYQFSGILLQHIRRLLDDTVHEWLREHGLINLIVTVTTVTHLVKIVQIGNLEQLR